MEPGMTTASLKVPFAEYSSFTNWIEPVLVQVMVWGEPTIHVSPPLGAVTVRAPWILKLDPELDVTLASSTLVIRTRTVAEMSSGTVQAKVPVFEVEAAIWIGVVKLS